MKQFQIAFQRKWFISKLFQTKHCIAYVTAAKIEFQINVMTTINKKQSLFINEL